MLPKWHFLVIFIISLFLWPSLKWNVLIIIFVAVFIDIDHYFTYIYRKKDLSLRRAYNFYIEKDEIFKKTGHFDKKYSLCIFHTIESVIAFSIMALIIPFFQFVFIGYAIHMFQDILSEILSCWFCYKMTRSYSVIRYIYEQQKVKIK